MEAFWGKRKKRKEKKILKAMKMFWGKKKTKKKQKFPRP